MNGFLPVIGITDTNDLPAFNAVTSLNAIHELTSGKEVS